MATGTLTLRRPVEFRSRVCGVTGLTVDQHAERLIKANAVTAIVFLLIGGIMAVFVAMTRWPAVGLLSSRPELFYRFLTAHGINMLIFWIVFFEVAGLYFGGAVLLNARLVKPRLAWFAFGTMLAGAILTDAVVFAGKADVMWDSYVPLKASPLFYVGYDLFAVGTFIAVGLFFATVVVARVEGRHTGSLPLVTFGLVTAGIIAVVTLIGGVIAFVPALLWSVGAVKLDAAVYRLNLWLFGHSSQQINLAAMVSVWYLLAALTVGAKPINQKLSRFAFVLYILFIDFGSVHHLLVDPGLTRSFKTWNTSYAMYGAVLGSMIHAYSIPAGMEVAQRARGYVHGLFEWLRKGPWSNPGFSALVISAVIFGFLAGTTGVAFGHDQNNITVHNTLAIPGHFHATVVAGTTLAFMGLTYYVIPLIFRRELVGRRWATIQPYVYGAGVLLLSVGMLVAGGSYGVPRRVSSIAYSGASAGVSFPSAAFFWLGVLGVGAIVAIVGGAMFVGIAVASVLGGKRIPIGGAPTTMTASLAAATDSDQAVDRRAPGTLVLVFAFLAVFAAVLAVVFARAAGLWPVG